MPAPGIPAAAPPQAGATAGAASPEFQQWWNTNPDVLAWRTSFRAKYGEEPSLDPNVAKYDYQRAYAAGVTPHSVPYDDIPHWSSQFKHADHPHRFVDGIDTITGQPQGNLTPKENSSMPGPSQVLAGVPGAPQQQIPGAGDTPMYTAAQLRAAGEMNPGMFRQHGPALFPGLGGVPIAANRGNESPGNLSYSGANSLTREVFPGQTGFPSANQLRQYPQTDQFSSYEDWLTKFKNGQTSKLWTEKPASPQSRGGVPQSGQHGLFDAAPKDAGEYGLMPGRPLPMYAPPGHPLFSGVSSVGQQPTRPGQIPRHISPNISGAPGPGQRGGPGEQDQPLLGWNQGQSNPNKPGQEWAGAPLGGQSQPGIQQAIAGRQMMTPPPIQHNPSTPIQPPDRQAGPGYGPQPQTFSFAPSYGSPIPSNGMALSNSTAGTMALAPQPPQQVAGQGGGPAGNGMALSYSGANTLTPQPQAPQVSPQIQLSAADRQKLALLMISGMIPSPQGDPPLATAPRYAPDMRQPPRADYGDVNSVAQLRALHNANQGLGPTASAVNEARVARGLAPFPGGYDPSLPHYAESRIPGAGQRPMNESPALVDFGRSLGPDSDMVRYMQDVPSGTARDYTNYVRRYGTSPTDSDPHRGTRAMQTYENTVGQFPAYERQAAYDNMTGTSPASRVPLPNLGMGQTPGKYDAAFQQHLADRDAWRGGGNQIPLMAVPPERQGMSPAEAQARLLQRNHDLTARISNPTLPNGQPNPDWGTVIGPKDKDFSPASIRNAEIAQGQRDVQRRADLLAGKNGANPANDWAARQAMRDAQYGWAKAGVPGGAAHIMARSDPNDPAAQRLMDRFVPSINAVPHAGTRGMPGDGESTPLAEMAMRERIMEAIDAKNPNMSLEDKTKLVDSQIGKVRPPATRFAGPSPYFPGHSIPVANGTSTGAPATNATESKITETESPAELKSKSEKNLAIRKQNKERAAIAGPNIGVGEWSRYKLPDGSLDLATIQSKVSERLKNSNAFSDEELPGEVAAQIKLIQEQYQKYLDAGKPIPFW